MREIGASSKKSEDALISIGAKYKVLLHEIEEEAKSAKKEAKKQLLGCIGVCAIASAISLASFLGCIACPLLIPLLGFTVAEVTPLATFSMGLGPLAFTAWVQFAKLNKIRDQMNKLESIYTHLSKKIQVEKNLWSEIQDHFTQYTGVSSAIKDAVVQTPRDLQAFEKNMETVDEYLIKLIAAINQYLKAVESKHWEYINTMCEAVLQMKL